MRIDLQKYRRGFFNLLVVAALLIAIFPLLFAQSMMRGLNHDEHQHLAAGYLITTKGLLPYRDFPFFHTPNMPFIYGMFMQRGEWLLLEARLFSTICAALTAGVIAWMALKWTSGRRWRIVVALGASLLLVASPVFSETIGRASNHDFSVFLALLATCCHLGAMARGRGGAGWVASGILLGLAIGARVTLAPLVLPFFIAVWLWSGSGSLADRVKKAAIFSAGLFVGCLPMIVMFVIAPEGFFYGVLEFSRTNLAYRASTGNTQTMSLLTKLRYFFQPISIENWSVILVLAGALGLYAWQQWKLRT
ncbi:MAG: glycosyltransferase family 39 protein, partial [Chthoniobacterales bacterium]